MRYPSLVLLGASPLLIGAASSVSVSGKSIADIRVDTSVGTVEGFVDPALPGVKQWLGVPFAEPPVGPLRWKAPVPKARARSPIAAKTAPKSCQQFITPGPGIFNTLVPEFNPVAQFSEDCLYLNVIAPVKPCTEALPVLVWVHGGALQGGGINTPYERPQQWVQRSQGHIVVQINYRLNIFGFPNAVGLPETNFGIQDTRLALEWVRDNIARFGGDPKNIILWGQSAGAGACDAHQFAWPTDTIFKSLILESATVLTAHTTTDLNRTSFAYVAHQLGAPASAPPEEQVAFLRGISADAIEAFLMNNTVNGGPSLYFSAQDDGKFVFSPAEYVARGKAGRFANVPIILGSNSEEGSLFVPFSVNGTGITPAKIKAVTDAAVQCSVATTSQYRQASGRVTYRYFYTGNFTNISPASWIGAYHFSEIPLVMGTHSDFRSKSTEFETDLSHKMQDLWLAFANEDWKGLKGAGWTPSNGTALVLGSDGKLTGSEAIAVLDANVCPPAS